MAEISNEQLNHLEELSELEFSAEAKQKMKKDLTQIVSFINEIESCNLKLEELPERCVPLASLRDDEPETGLSQEEALANAPRKADGYYSVAKVVD
ncbi:MAG: Asp-tRNA(Asn)/Glu-tRNA(Gln) amidotransferase subunit GatC [Clostridia bacterium]|nr:Asp-tRNA(Asn)/Glu-tRNA(Gln) amidotransferase subunit GatC [Clostridia bacterium]